MVRLFFIFCFRLLLISIVGFIGFVATFVFVLFLGEFAIAISVAVIGFKVCCFVGALISCAEYG